ncbi:hypothetical protein GGS23DRAFT_525627 [Durotheca rogersii]|uniref:uncharacterized protein n=1 Tax=Durotheca rogersii TaxID=419775 RepID=UPI00221E639F|nr:uncharacterized protein GGS23DRAFT_525627 [Durotheca rogersii]KAI5863295.1 hypothetical protein GGS23DRAFT_525627 [Durotheca rogersii]
MSYQLRPTQQWSLDGGYGTYEYGYDQECGHGYGPQQGDYNNPLLSPPMVSVPPSAATFSHYCNTSLARTQTWVADQPPFPSPPPTAKLPLGEWASPNSDTTFDRHMLGGRSAAIPSRPSSKRDERICGVERTPFFVVLAIGLFLLVVAIAAGLGVGLGTRRHYSGTPLATPSR